MWKTGFNRDVVFVLEKDLITGRDVEGRCKSDCMVGQLVFLLETGQRTLSAPVIVVIGRYPERFGEVIAQMAFDAQDGILAEGLVSCAEVPVVREEIART